MACHSFGKISEYEPVLQRMTAMAHHKRKGPKSTRSGCLLCKPHKRQGTCTANRHRAGERAKRAAAERDIREA